MEKLHAEPILEFSELKKGDHVVAINKSKSQHGIFLGILEGVVKFGTYDVDGRYGPETVDLLKFANDANEKFVRITYERETCIDPSKTLSYALSRDFFNINESGAQNAFKCKTGQSASEQTLHVLRRSTDQLMEKHYQQKTLQQLKNIKDSVTWMFK